MRKIHGDHLLFGLTLLTLAVLGVRLALFFGYSVELERTARLNELLHATVVSALQLGMDDRPPAVGPLPGASRSGTVMLEVIPATQHREGDLFSPAIPRYPQLGVRPDPQVVAAIEQRVHLRRIMVVGESSLLFLLLGICSFMLYRLVRQERLEGRRMEIFVSSVTHEMKTPLAGIKSLLQTLAAGRVPAEQEQKLYAMGLKETERLEHTVENVLISGRLRTERYQLEPEPLPLKPLLEALLEHRQRYLVGAPASIRLQWELQGDDAAVLADRSALRVVLENLLDNALKYGGPAPQVSVRVAREAGRLLLSVEDQGVGFSPEQAEELFVPFRRSLSGKQAVQHGTGLGLSISRALVRQMGGELWAASAGPGQGSRFTVSLREARR